MRLTARDYVSKLNYWDTHPDSTLEYQHSNISVNHVQHLPLLVCDLKPKTFSYRHVPRRTKPSVHRLFNKSASSLVFIRCKWGKRGKRKETEQKVGREYYIHTTYNTTVNGGFSQTQEPSSVLFLVLLARDTENRLFRKAAIELAVKTPMLHFCAIHLNTIVVCAGGRGACWCCCCPNKITNYSYLPILCWYILIHCKNNHIRSFRGHICIHI